MGVQLLSVSYKTTPIEIRSLFAFNEEQQEMILDGLCGQEHIEEAVVLSTCNRMEVYCYSDDQADASKIFEQMLFIVSGTAGADHVENLRDYILLYQGQKAMHHLFRVAAGLDSMVIGEDQILGQVKHAHEFSHSRNRCSTYLNTLFRYAVTCSKKIKTDTVLSKTSVSTATLAVKAAEHELGGLQDKKMMIIGASGKIGGIVLKNAGCIKGLSIYVTSRNHLPGVAGGGHVRYEVIPYDERYSYMDDMDVIISATSSPHYTVTKNHFEKCRVTDKPRVFVDLAVPMDIEKAIGNLEHTSYFNIEDMKELARQNNEKKQADIKAADKILDEYEDQFSRWLLFQTHRTELDRLKCAMMEDANDKGIDTAINHLFYKIREGGSLGEVDAFMSVVSKIIAET
ncbi:glutamyl-tRNA reductase [Clostridium sp. chh4-2]|uniref:glutamyl-tRNA reductase n=1 Tax=Clostridium sp. chh4-2 TaxID=2067550 RepID=UPI000CCDE548|nr:glutamyl-tRNA reductase [Clostridium sp. chh4-2]PNV63216.1 glutamyl-tRNA reductase [Clostridium sp. chh4-2]